MWRVLLILLALCSAAQAQTGGGGITPTGAITPGNCMKWGPTKFKAADAGTTCGGAGTVTSVGLALPTNLFVVSGSPVIAAGTLTGTLTPQSANLIFAGPGSGGAVAPTFRSLVAADVPSAILPGSFSGFANPSASVGLTTVNGSATTALRSDGAPALDQTAAFAFTGLGNTNLLTGSALSWNSDFIVTRGAAATGQLGAANVDTGPVSQTLRAQGVITGSGTSNVAGANLTIASGQGKGNATGSTITFQTPLAVGSGTGAQTLTTALILNGSQQTAVIAGTASVPALTFRSGTDTTVGFYSPAASSIAWSSGSAARLLINSGQLRFSSDTTFGFASTTDPVNQAADTIFTRAAAAAWQMGAANAAAPVAQTLQVQGSRVGTDTNTGGANLTVASGIGTGTGSPSGITFQTPTQTISGKTAQTLATSMIITNGAASIGSATLSISPGSFGITRIVTSAVAPGALGGKLELICGATAGTARLVVYAGTSATPITVVDNIGTGVSGC